MSFRKKHIKNKLRKIKPKKPFFKRRIFWYLILIFVILFITIYFVVFYSGFFVKNIIISGNEKVFSQELENVTLKKINKNLFGFWNWDIYTKSILLVNSKNINKEILEKFPIIEKIKIDKILPNSLILSITERKPVGVYCPSADLEQTNCFLIDQNGIIFEDSPRFVSNLIMISQNMQSENILMGEEIINKNIIDAIIKIEKNIKDNFQINLTEAFLSNPLRLDIKTSENWKIYFNLDFDINSQLTKLNLLLREQIFQEEREKIEYIDLRFKDRAYYK
jgi:cell division septal protein FtsQ